MFLHSPNPSIVSYTVRATENTTPEARTLTHMKFSPRHIAGFPAPEPLTPASRWNLGGRLPTRTSHRLGAATRAG